MSKIKTQICAVIALLTIGYVAVYAQTTTKQIQDKTKEQVDNIIKEKGSISPDWWNSIELNYPATLDMNWPIQQSYMQGRGGRGGFGGSRGIDFNRNVDQYINNVIYGNPSRYKDGIKLINYLMTINKDDKEKLKRSLNTLGNMFYDLFGDYTRAAFWWQKDIERGGTVDQLKMAYCYYELGSKSTAIQILSQAGTTQSRSSRDTIKLWAKIGEVDKALAMLTSNTGSGGSMDRMGFGGRGGSQSDNNLLAGEICRLAGKYDLAITYYQKAVSASGNQSYFGGRGGGRDMSTRANANMEAVKLLSTLNIKSLPDGTYSGSCMGFGGILYVNVSVRKGQIESVTVTQNQETPSYLTRALPTARKIVVQQAFNVDTVTGATITSDAIINSAIKALASSIK
jgi:uncharacterized protein with FMN-binding domain